jgi:hypothetical protein
MAIATWWRGDTRPDLTPLANLEVSNTTDITTISSVNELSPSEVRRRIAAGNQPYVAFLNGVPAAYGWVASERVDIGELGIDSALPAGDRYLWDFGTVPNFRGLGIYPRLLDAILSSEAERAERFWIIHAPENAPSGVGMSRAGFESIAELSFTADSGVALRPMGDSGRVLAAAQLLGVPLAAEPVAECWLCESSSGCGCRSADSCACHVTPHWPGTAGDVPLAS